MNDASERSVKSSSEIINNYGAVFENMIDYEAPNGEVERPIALSSNEGINRSDFLLKITTILVVCAVCIFSVGFLINQKKSFNQIIFSITSNYETSVADNVGFNAKVSNEYSNLGMQMFSYPFLEGALLVEPYRLSTVTMRGGVGGCMLKWKLTHITDALIELSGTSTANIGTTFDLSPTKTGEYVLNVDEYCNNDLTIAVNSLEQKLWVKYVRRELMSLTDVDREEFLDAFRTLWDIPTIEGIKKYGPKYKSLHYFAMVHNDAGANSICDEFHAGAGFLNNHLFLGMYLEQSMRLINPRVSLHYMEYTKYFDSQQFASHIMNPLDGGNWTELLSAKWFGSNNPYTGEIITGRWAKTIIPTVDSTFCNAESIPESTTFFPNEGANWMKKTGQPHIYSPYGLLRAPWNYNPSPYLTRYNNLNRLPMVDVSEHIVKPYMGSTCEDLKRFLNDYTKNKQLITFLESAEDIIHGYIHFTFGGMGGQRATEIDTILRDKYGLSNTHLYYVAESAHKFYKTHLSNMDLTYVNPLNCTKNPYQNNILTSSALPGDENGPLCSCNDLYFQSEENLDILIGLYFNHFMPTDDSLKDLEYNEKTEIMKLVCSRMSYEGEMGGSGAAQDPLFWVAHGAVERLYQRVMFANVVLDKVYKSQGRGGKCSGHDTDGVKLWLKGFYLQDITIDTSILTNTELINILDPTSDNYGKLVDTVYEDSTWPWCSGFDSWLTL